MGSKKYRNRRPTKKLSEALIHIAQPLLDDAEPEDTQGILKMAVAAWVVSVSPDPAKPFAIFEKSIQEEYGDDPEMIEGLMIGFDVLLNRKELLYPHDMRIPLDFSFEETDDGTRFHVTGFL